ncbi:MAG: hypothetical protein QXY79_03840 [Candidatus Methanomethylicia archaeon]
MYKISKLIKLNQRLYHTKDLAKIWGISNQNTLYTTIKRYVEKGILIPIFKGLYSTIPLEQVDPIEIGSSIAHRYAYLSTEYVLAEKGIIQQAIDKYTFISNFSRRIKVGEFNFLFRKLKDEFLFNPIGIEKKDNSFIASTERAVADLLYFNPHYHFDLPHNINWNEVRNIQKLIGYK